MSVLVFNVVTAALMVLLFKVATTLVEPGTLRSRRIPWAAILLTIFVVAGLVLQASWAGAMDALDSDPSRDGWWRLLTSVFMQNGGFLGDLWNLITLAVVAALAEWFWGSWLTLGLFLAGMLLPHGLDLLAGVTDNSTDPRNFAGSSGATYFLGATLAGALLLIGPGIRQRLLALAVPAVGIIAFLAQGNGHGLVSAEGCALGVITWLLLHRWHTFNRDSPRLAAGSSSDTGPSAVTAQVRRK